MKHQLALVTGATSGIGEALCRLLARQGINLIASGRSMDRLLKLQAELKSQIDIQVVTCDLENNEQLDHLIEILHEKCPDLIINNAGFGLYGEALTYPTSEQLSILEVNGKVPLELTLESARTLIERKKQGVILNISSAAAFQIFPTLAVYSAVKSFVNHFSQSLDYEFRSYGVRVLAACPGMVDTQFQTRAGSNDFSDQGIRAMSAEEVANLMWKQIQSQKPLVIMNWKYRILTALTKFIPQSWLSEQLSKNVLSRIEPGKVK